MKNRAFRKKDFYFKPSIRFFNFFKKENTKVNMETLTPWQRYSMGFTNKAIFVISAILSVFGSLLIVITYNSYKDIQSPTRHIIACLSLADLFTVLANFYGIFTQPGGYREKTCILQSFIGGGAAMSSYLWTMALAIYLYVSLVKDNSEILEKLLHPWFHLICWLLPLGINIVALFLNKLGNGSDRISSGWCWIKISPSKDWLDQLTWMIIDGEGILVLTLIVIFVLYISIKIYLKKKVRIFVHLK